MSLRAMSGYVPDSVIPAHRLGANFVAALEAGNERKAMRLLRRILHDKDGQTSWYLLQDYKQPERLLELKTLLQEQRG